MKKNMGLLIVLIVTFISLVILFFKALDSEQPEVADKKPVTHQKKDSAHISEEQSTDFSDELLSKEDQNEKVVLFRTAKGYVDSEQYKQAIPPIRRLIELDAEEAAYWYEYIRALHALHDCEIMGAIEKYLSLCPGAEACFDGGVEWSEKNYDYLKNTHCKDYKN